MKCGLLGGKLGHSYSPQIHGMLGQYPYHLYEKTPEELGDFLLHGSFTGLNVTIPYKKAVIPYCSRLSPTARRLGAVNTLLRLPDGTLEGHNTDYAGFLEMLRRCDVPLTGKKALVLGSGGASNTAVAALADQGALPVVISRSGENNYGNLQRHSDAALIVNATPLGTYPNVGTAALDVGQFPRLEAVLDLNYNPARTRLLLDAERLGIPTQNGLAMLVAQAAKSCRIWGGPDVGAQGVAEICGTLRRQMMNLVLIGMPGCGKTTVGKALARATGMKFVDADQVLQQRAGCSAGEYILRHGEPAFRALETQVLAELGKESGQVLATGGGCVTREENDPLLHQNGDIFWLRRGLDKLPTDGRPLSQAESLEAMFARRAPLYQRFADCTVDNNGTPEETVQDILARRMRL